MAWTAKVKDKEKNEDGSVRLVIVLKKDGNGPKKQLEFLINSPGHTMEWLTEQIQNHKNNIVGLDTSVLALQKDDTISVV